MTKMKRKRVGPRITFQQADDIRKLVADGMTLTDIAARYSISVPYASLISRNLRKKRRVTNEA